MVSWHNFNWIRPILIVLHFGFNDAHLAALVMNREVNSQIILRKEPLLAHRTLARSFGSPLPVTKSWRFLLALALFWAFVDVLLAVYVFQNDRAWFWLVNWVDFAFQDTFGRDRSMLPHFVRF